jgi:hypothetical protein
MLQTRVNYLTGPKFHPFRDLPHQELDHWPGVLVAASLMFRRQIMSDPRDFDRNKDLDRNREMGSRDFERNRYADAPATRTGSNVGWISAAVIALLLLGGLAIYASRDDGTTTASSPTTETTGQKSTAPAPSNTAPKAPANTPAPSAPAGK